MNNKIKCLLYLRVSTKKQGSEGESLETQEKICCNFAERKEWQIIRIFKEQYSGRKDDRPEFDKLIEYIKQNPKEIQYVVIKVIDRFTRGGTYSYEDMKRKLATLNVKLIDTQGIIQEGTNTLEHLGISYDWSRINNSAVTEHVMAENAKMEVSGILTRTIGQQIILVRDGYHVGQCDDGFINKKTLFGTKKKTIRIKDPERSVFFEKMFEMRATNRYSDQEIVDEINAMGFKTRIRNRWSKNNQEITGKVGGRPLSVKLLQETIVRPTYCGLNCHKWNNYKPIKSHSEKIVSIETFNQANRGKVYINQNGDDTYEILYDYYPEKIINRRNRNNELFPFKNVVLCPHCYKPFLGSSPKGKSGKHFPTYHCARGHKYFGINKEQFDKSVMDLLEKIKINPLFAKHFDLFVLDVWRTKKQDLIRVSGNMNQNISELQSQQDLTIDKLTMTENELVRKKLEEKIEKLESEIQKIKQSRNKADVAEDEITSFIKYAKILMEHPHKLFKFSNNTNKKEALASLIFEDFPTYTQVVNGTPNLTLIFNQLWSKSNGKSFTARDVGIEPTLTVLETAVLPLYESRNLFQKAVIKTATITLIWFLCDECASCNACSTFLFPACS